MNDIIHIGYGQLDAMGGGGGSYFRGGPCDGGGSIMGSRTIGRVTFPKWEYSKHVRNNINSSMVYFKQYLLVVIYIRYGHSWHIYYLYVFWIGFKFGVNVGSARAVGGQQKR
jgi:hypothetical protein